MIPYKTTQEFDATSLPPALRQHHAAKAGTWGVIRVLEGELRLTFDDGRTLTLTRERPGTIEPEERHRVEPVGTMRMKVEFYRAPPNV